MAMRYAGPAAFAARRSSSQTRHLGRQAGLIDEDELRRIEIELTVEPVPASLQDVGAILLQYMCGLFLNVQPWPRSQSLKVLRPMCTERSASRRSTISFSVMSLRSSIMPKTKSAYPSRREPLLRPCRRGDTSPIFARAIQRIALDAPTPNRVAAERADAPSAPPTSLSSRRVCRHRQSMLPPGAQVEAGVQLLTQSCGPQQRKPIPCNCRNPKFSMSCRPPLDRQLSRQQIRRVILSQVKACEVVSGLGLFPTLLCEILG